MAALMDLRVFKLCLAIASVLLVFLGVGVMVFGTKLGMIPANAVPILSVMVWLGCVGSVIRRWFRSKRPCEQLDPATGRLPGQITSEFHWNRLILGPSGPTLYCVVLPEGSVAPGGVDYLAGYALRTTQVVMER